MKINRWIDLFDFFWGGGCVVFCSRALYTPKRSGKESGTSCWSWPPVSLALISAKTATPAEGKIFSSLVFIHPFPIVFTTLQQLHCNRMYNIKRMTQSSAAEFITPYSPLDCFSCRLEPACLLQMLNSVRLCHLLASTCTPRFCCNSLPELQVTFSCRKLH